MPVDDAYGGYRGMWRDAEDEVAALRAEVTRQRHALERIASANEPRQQCPVCSGFLPDERNGGVFTCPRCGTEFG